MRSLLLGIFILVGVVGGVYFGRGLAGESNRQDIVFDVSRRPLVPDNKMMTFDIGDLLPQVECTDLRGNGGDLHSLISGKRAIVFFSSRTCGPCISTLKLWDQHLFRRIKKDVRLVFCFPTGEDELDFRFSEFHQLGTTCILDKKTVFDFYNINVRPTIVGVNQNGYIEHIQFGYSGKIDLQWKELYCR